MTLQFSLVGTEDGSNITVWVHGQKPQVAQSDHPNFDRIVEGAMAGDDSVIELFDIAETAAKYFDRLSERVTVANGRLYLDGEEVDNALSAQVVRFLDTGEEDWQPLVNFFENVQQNPQEHSRKQLYGWLSKRDFTITPDGLIVGYKGTKSPDDEGAYASILTGTATVDGEIKSGNIPNYPGAVIEMPRGQVQFDPSVGCSTGLHVGTYEYASNFSQGGLLEVLVNPRDVVSVPTDSYEQKMRVCRYTVVDTIEQEYTAPVRYYPEEEFEFDEDEDRWGFEDDIDDWGY